MTMYLRHENVLSQEAVTHVEIVASFSEKEMGFIVQLKRFMKRLIADAQFFL